MTDRKRLFKLNERELHELLELYFCDEVESCPINAQAFIDVFMEKFEVKSLMSNESVPIDGILSADWKVTLFPMGK